MTERMLASALAVSHTVVHIWLTPSAPLVSCTLTQTILDCAMHYSRLGLAVLPLHYPVPNKDGSVWSCGRSDCSSPAKHPVGYLAPNGIKNATTEPQLLERWFKDYS
jgi:hypothetical protein